MSSALWNQRPTLLRSATSLLPFLGMLLLAVASCREQPTTVSGTITFDGKPLKVTSDTRGTVVFQPLGGVGTVATGLIDAAGNFQLATGSSNEIAPGNYFVSVTVARLVQSSDQSEAGSKLLTPAKYSSARDSGLQAKVQPGANHVKFELNSTADSTDTSLNHSDDSSPPAEDHTPGGAQETSKR